MGQMSPQVIPKCSGTTTAGSQMMNHGRWLIVDPVTTAANSICEFGLEVIGYTHELFIKPPELQCGIATYRKIATHKICNPCWSNRGEVEAIVAGEISVGLPRLNNATSHKRRASFLHGGSMCLNQP
jgi:hypothetical protein